MAFFQLFRMGLHSATLTVFSAILYCIPFTCPAFWPLCFVALIPLFFALDKKTSLIRLAGTGFLWGVLMILGLSYWVTSALTGHFHISWPVALIFMFGCIALPIGLLYALFALGYRALRPGGILFVMPVLPSLWILAESVRELVPVMIPWGFIGYAAMPCTHFIQIADVGGVYILGFIIVSVNALTYHVIVSIVTHVRNGERNQHFVHAYRDAIIHIALIVALIAIPCLYGTARIRSLEKSIHETKAAGFSIPSTVVQPQLHQQDRWRTETFIERVNMHLGLSKTGEGARGIIVWPETVLNASGMVDDNLFAYLTREIGKSAVLFAGGVRRESDDTIYNSVYAVSGNGGLSSYDKKILLPFAETTPFGASFGQYYEAPARFDAGNRPSVLHTPLGSAGISICFEILYPWHVRNSVLQGAHYCINVSNDAWFINGDEPFLHHQAARLRAVEQRRYLLRASNSGISSIISPTGQLGGIVQARKGGAAHGEIVPLRIKTIYCILGDWMPLAASTIICAGFILSIRTRA